MLIVEIIDFSDDNDYDNGSVNTARLRFRKKKMIILIFFLTVICSYQILVEIDLNFNGF